MTIEQKAREIAEKTYHSALRLGPNARIEAARLGIIEGLEMAAKVADRHTYPSALVTSEGKAKDIAKAIRALIEEQKP